MSLRYLSNVVTLEYDPEKCTGCMACVKRCPKDGIAGELKKPHFIDRQKCIKCGICYDVCKFDAVAKK